MSDWLAVWRFGYEEDASLQMRRHDDNEIWNSMINIEGGFSYNPRLFPGESGYWILSSTDQYYYESEEMHAAIRFSSDNGQTWTEPNIQDGLPSRPVQFSYGGNGKWIGISSVMQYHYSRFVPPEPLYLITSDDNGVNWTSKVPFMPGCSIVNGAAAQIVSDKKGNWIIIWQALVDESIGKHWQIFSSYSSDNGVTWSPRSTLE